MCADDIKKLIESNIDQAFDELDKVFDNTNGDYNDLSREYYSRPNNFDMATFRSKLKRFVQLHKKDIDDYFKENALDNAKPLETSEDEHFRVLAGIDFKLQEGKFLALMKDRNFATFLVRGKDACGQSWLIHQLAKKKLPCSVKIHIRGNTAGTFPTLDNFIEILKSITKTEFSDTDNHSEKLLDIAENLAKTCSKDYVIVADCPPNFVMTNDFVLFYESFIKTFTRKARNLQNKIVFFLKDTTADEYKLPQNINYWCCEKPVGDEIEFLTNWQDKTSTSPYLIDLHSITPLSLEMIWEWRTSITDLPLLKKFKDKDCIEKLLEVEYENGNPYKVILDVSSILDYTDRSWLKY